MQTRHVFIATFEAQPGMRLARPLTKVFNQRLFSLPAGTDLTADLIRQMAARDVHCLVVERPDPRDGAQLERDRARIEADTRRIFARADLGRPAVAGLYAAVMTYRLAHA